MTSPLRDLLQPMADTDLGRRARQRMFAARFHARMIEMFDRPAWLYRSHGAIPSTTFHFRSANRVTPQDVALCQRLLDAFQRARDDGTPRSGMWTTEVFQERQRELLEALEGGRPEVLAERLASMLRSEFVLGMASGSLGIAKRSRLTHRLRNLQILSKLAALGESQGTARLENPEQGEVGLAFANGLERLVAETERALGVSLDFPDVGAAYGIQVAGRLISGDSLDQIYAAARIRDAIDEFLPEVEPPVRIVEIGGGYGAMAYWLVQMVSAEYVVVDLPIVNVLQGYFLAQSLGHDAVSLYGEDTGRVAVLPTHALADIELPFDVLVNKDSLPEIPLDAAERYLNWAREGCDGIFFSYNQEAAAALDGEAQIVVPEILARLGGFDRLTRNPSWLRPGYAEEVYRVRASAP
jgi:hypothetical protein